MEKDFEREKRLKNNYLESRYQYNNYDDFIIIETQNEEIVFRPMDGIHSSNLIRKRTSFDREFYMKGLYTQHAFKKKYSDNYIEYIPGTLDCRMNHYSHPITFGKILIESILEKREWNEEKGLIINLTVFSENKFEEYKYSLFDDKEKKCAELSENEDWYNKDLNIFSFTSINRDGIFSSSIIINLINKFIEEGLNLSSINPHFGINCFIQKENVHDKIFDFCDQLIFKTWSEVTSIVGKDNRISGGEIIENIPNDPYLIKLIEDNTEFVRIDSGRMKSYDEVDYGYIPSRPYNESEIKSDSLKKRILFIIIEKFDRNKDLIYSMAKQ